MARYLDNYNFRCDDQKVEYHLYIKIAKLYLTEYYEYFLIDHWEFKNHFNKKL